MATTGATREELEVELARLKDREAILDLLYAYCHAIDGGDTEGWLDCFTEDAAWVVWFVQGDDPIYDMHGRDEIRGYIEPVHAAGPAGANHLTVNPRVLAIDGDEATAASYYVTARFQNDVLDVTGTGRYKDKLVRCSDGRWRIKERLAWRNVVFTET
jgi:uncharacterized protein (TIGR02246 family)